jgi:hypothetical protein
MNPKRIYIVLLLAVILFGQKVEAQLVDIRDAGFSSYLCNNSYYSPLVTSDCRHLDTVKAGNFVSTLCNCDSSSIANAAVIVYFKKVGGVSMKHNNITTFPTLKSTLPWTSLDLSYNKLEIAPDLSPLKNTLKTLNLSHNNLVSLQDSTINLKNLQSLNVSYNNLRSFINVSSLKNLDELNVSFNYLSFKDFMSFLSHSDFQDDFNFSIQKPLTNDTTLWLFEGTDILLNAHIDEGIPGLNYAWYKGGNLVQSFKSNPLQLSNIQFADSGQYIVVVSSDSSKLKGVTIKSGLYTIKVKPCQEIENFSFSTTTTCEKSTATLNSVQLTNPDPSFNLLLENAITQSRIPIQVQQPQGVVNGAYHLVASNGTTCTVKKENALKVSSLPSCPFVFSPNGDGIQDELFLDGNGDAFIINKEGLTVKNLRLPAYWNGSGDKGEEVPLGTYILFKKDGSNDKITVLR